MAARLEADERQRRSLLADVSHELRTPLAVVQGNVEALVDGVHPADAAHLAAILDETRVLGRLIDDLRTLALSEAGTLPLHREPTDLALLIADVARSFAPVAEADRAAIDVSGLDGPDADLPLVDVDPIRIREVLTNLVANALRYSPPDATIEVGAVPRRRRTDRADRGPRRGPGSPPELVAHVFDRFARSTDSAWLGTRAGDREVPRRGARRGDRARRPGGRRDHGLVRAAAAARLTRRRGPEVAGRRAIRPCPGRVRARMIASDAVGRPPTLRGNRAARDLRTHSEPVSAGHGRLAGSPRHAGDAASSGPSSSARTMASSATSPWSWAWQGRHPCPA